MRAYKERGGSSVVEHVLWEGVDLCGLSGDVRHEVRAQGFVTNPTIMPDALSHVDAHGIVSLCYRVGMSHFAPASFVLKSACDCLLFFGDIPIEVLQAHTVHALPVVLFVMLVSIYCFGANAVNGALLYGFITLQLASF